MDQRHLACKARQKIRLFHRGIAAADHRDVFASEEISVARGASRDSVPHQFSFGLKPQHSRRCARGNDQRAAFVILSSRCELERTLAQIHFRNRATFELGAKTLRLFAHILDELGTQNSVRESGIVFDVRGQGKLATGFVAINHQWLHVSPRGVNRGRESRAPASDYDDVLQSILRAHAPAVSVHQL